MGAGSHITSKGRTVQVPLICMQVQVSRDCNSLHCTLSDASTFALKHTAHMRELELPDRALSSRLVST